MTQSGNNTPVIVIHDGKAVTSSKDVAQFFGKRHTHVLDAIRDLMLKGGSEIEPKFRPFENNDLTGTSTSHYEMDRDGFTLLAMGFTGSRALKWKLRYIDAFNEMERRLRQNVTVMPPALTDDDRKILFGTFTTIARREISAATEKIGKQLTDQNRHLWRAITRSRNAVSLQGAGFVEIGAVYKLAGLAPSGLPGQGKLSGNISRALDAYCKRHACLSRSAQIGSREVTHWPEDAVIAWLSEHGHAMIRAHLATMKPPPQPELWSANNGVG